MPTYDYVALERLLRQALELVQEQILPEERQDTLEYLDVGEYGLAFETLASAVVAANAPITQEFCGAMRDAAQRMEYRDDFSDALEPEIAAALARACQANA